MFFQDSQQENKFVRNQRKWYNKIGSDTMQWVILKDFLPEHFFCFFSHSNLIKSLGLRH